MSETIYVGSRPQGRRVHFTTSEGFSECGLRCIDVKPIEELEERTDDMWCKTCVTRIIEQELIWGGLSAERRPVDLPGVILDMGRAIRALQVAVETLVKIAELDDAAAAEIDAPTGVALARGLARAAAEQIK